MKATILKQNHRHSIRLKWFKRWLFSFWILHEFTNVIELNCRYFHVRETITFSIFLWKLAQEIVVSVVFKQIDNSMRRHETKSYKTFSINNDSMEMRSKHFNVNNRKLKSYVLLSNMLISILEFSRSL